MRSIIFLLFLCNISLAQSWETLIPHIKTDYEQFEISDYSTNGFFIAGYDHLISIDNNGEIQNVIPSENPFKRVITDSKAYLFYEVDDIINLEIKGKKGSVEKTISIAKNGQTLRDVAVLDATTLCIILRDGNNVGTMGLYDHDGNLLNQTTVDPNARLHISEDGRIALSRSGTHQPFEVYNSDLESLISIKNTQLGSTLIYDLAFGDNGEIFFAGNTAGSPPRFNVGRMDSNGELLELVTYDSPINAGGSFDLESWPFGLAKNGDVLAVYLTTVEVNERLDVICLNTDLELINTFTRENGGLQSNIVANSIGGFMFGFGEPLDPLAAPFSVKKRPVFYSIDGSCTLEPSKTKVSGQVYIDNNANGVFDEGDDPAQNAKLLHLPDSVYSYADENGFYEFRFNDGANSIELVPTNECFEVQEPYIFNAEELTVCDNFHFNLIATSDEKDLEVHVYSPPSRCGFPISKHISVVNTGCSSFSGTLTAGNLHLLTFAGVDQDSVWNIEDLPPFGIANFTVNVTVADENFDGDTTRMDISFIGDEISFDSTFMTVITCAIDPNDKKVNPVVVSPEKELFSEIRQELFYTVRFQNEGSDTAFTIRIEDTLSSHLDIQSMRPIMASHQYHLQVRGNVVNYIFDNILLPHQEIDSLGSQGFVTFGIYPKQNLADFTEVNNTANIYFDYNNPIITNTVEHILVEHLDEDNDEYYFWDDCDDRNSAVNPGMAEVPDNGLDDNCDGELEVSSSVEDGLRSVVDIYPNPANEYIKIDNHSGEVISASLLSITGVSFWNQRIDSAGGQIDVDIYSCGVYFLQLVSESGELLRVEKITILK